MSEAPRYITYNGRMYYANVMRLMRLAQATLSNNIAYHLVKQDWSFLVISIFI